MTYTLQERNVGLNILPRWGNYKLKEIDRVEYKNGSTNWGNNIARGQCGEFTAS
ncbi:hypothetical protein L0P96_10195 [Anoxybacillus flavithermus]